MNTNKIREITLIGLGMACVFVGTMIIIPNATGGYFNLGDGFIMLFASIVNPLGAFLIGGVTSSIVDAVSGYAPYIIPTLLTKGLEAVAISYIMHKNKNINTRYFAYFIGSLVMVSGYFISEIYLNQSIGIAFVALPANILQAFVGFVIGIVLYPTIYKLANTQRK